MGAIIWMEICVASCSTLTDVRIPLPWFSFLDGSFADWLAEAIDVCPRCVRQARSCTHGSLWKPRRRYRGIIARSFCCNLAQPLDLIECLVEGGGHVTLGLIESIYREAHGSFLCFALESLIGARAAQCSGRREGCPFFLVGRCLILQIGCRLL